MHVSLTGSTGFVGRHLLEHLLQAGHRVTALVRDPTSEGASALMRRPISANVQLTLVQGDVVDAGGLEDALRGSHTEIHLVGIIAEVGKQTFERVHVRGTENVVQAARRVGVKRFVQMSAIGARPNGVSEYQTSKYRAEEAVRNSGIP
ncbi:MAG TPA: NAD(P)H-binding protein, partial [Terriglobales bacterium]